jgi:hypothetical protein
MANSGGHPGQKECQLRRKLTLNRAAQQNGADPLPPIGWRPVIGRFVTILLKNSVPWNSREQNLHESRVAQKNLG